MAAQFVAMAEHKKLPDCGTRKHHHNQHQPILRVVVSEAVMAAEHGEQHRQGEVGVVHTALLAALAVHRVHRLTSLDRRNHLFLARNDPEEHTGAHAGRQHGPHQQKGRAPGEPMAGQPRGQAHQQKHHATDDGIALLALAQRATDKVIQQPKHHQKRQCHADGSGWRPVHF